MDAESAIISWLDAAERRPLGVAADAVLRGMRPPSAVAYLTELFENSGKWFDGVPDAEVASVLRFFVDGNESNYGPRCVSPQLPLTVRARYIRSVAVLFASTFNQRLSGVSRHGAEGPLSPLQALCESWWETCPLITRTGPDVSDIDAKLVVHLWELLHDVILLPSAECALSAAGGCVQYAIVPGSRLEIARILRDLPRRKTELPMEAAANLVTACALATAV